MCLRHRKWAWQPQNFWMPWTPLSKFLNPPLSLLCLSVFGKFLMNFTDTHISLSHTVHNRQIWGICKGYMQDYAPGMGACSIRTCRFPSYSQALEVGQTTDRCVSVHVAVTVQSVLIQIPPLALPLLPISVSLLHKLCDWNWRLCMLAEGCHVLQLNYSWDFNLKMFCSHFKEIGWLLMFTWCQLTLC